MQRHAAMHLQRCAAVQRLPLPPAAPCHCCRKCYFEHPSYVPLLHESYRLWNELEAETGEVSFFGFMCPALRLPEADRMTACQEAQLVDSAVHVCCLRAAAALWQRMHTQHIAHPSS